MSHNDHDPSARYGTGEHRDDIPQEGFHAEFNDDSGGYDQYEDGVNVYSHEKWMEEYLDKVPENPDSENV